MPYYLAETYSPKPAWINLPAEEKAAYFAKVGEGMGPLMEMGIEPLAFCTTEVDVPHSEADTFFALWRCPDRAALNGLIAAIAGTGWHTFFETRHFAGAGDDINAHLGQLAKVSL